ncbi:GerMN domain-containing protein [Kovacikia minuta CCNUW1]|uniref:GerMN domain-containing protein n=1 Tax=Kovacikia minuta TaxID=2931930 RepID=UPI001CC98AE1|nr:GerMN domain-containing protein [Kovacikia minuta]UBF27700.1 GerMN domain-containing protein [Kovacikia minuta CCNUW1]
MQEQQSPRRLPVAAIAGLSVLIVTTGSAVAWWSWNSARRNSAPVAIEHSQSPQAGQASPPAASPPGEQTQPKLAPITVEKTLGIYWLKGSGQEVALTAVPVKLSSNGEPNAVLKAGMEKLLAGPTDTSVTTTIPRNTQLRSMATREDGIHVNLSQEFMTGGGSTSMTARVAQVLYTATSLNPDAKVWLSVEGKPLEVLGGEGLMLEQPITRKSFERDFSL